MEESGHTASSPPATRRGLSLGAWHPRQRLSCMQTPQVRQDAPPDVHLTSQSHDPEFGVKVLNKVTSLLPCFADPTLSIRRLPWRVRP